MALTLTQDDLDAIVVAVLAGMNLTPPEVNVTYQAGAELVDGMILANVKFYDDTEAAIAQLLSDAQVDLLSKLDRLIELVPQGETGYERWKARSLETVIGADSDTLKTLSDQLDGFTGITAQEVRDAMKLAPTAGDPATGSIDKHADDLLTYAAAAEPADIWAYGTRTLTEGTTTTTDATASGSITRKRGNSWSISLTLGAVTGYTSLWFTVKRSYDDADSASVLQVKLNSPSASDGLLYVNGAAATDATKGTITVSNAGTGAIVVAVDEIVTDDIAPGTYYYDAQALISGAVTTPDAGTFTVTADVTRSVT